MATVKQKKAVEKMVEKGGNVTQAMKEAWYSENTFNTPQKLTKSKGYHELLEEYWLTEDLIVKALVEDIKAKKQNRKPELELWAKIKGMLVDRQVIDQTVKTRELTEEEIDKEIAKLEEDEKRYK